MELFSEVYGNYYKAVGKLLSEASKHAVNEDDAKVIIDSCAFSDSSFFIIPKLVDGDWPLLNKTEHGFSSKFDTPSEMPLTTLQKSWLKSLLSDPKFQLFLSDKDLETVKNYLFDVDPIYHDNDFVIYDSARDGDDFADPKYKKNFKVILDAIKEKCFIKVLYNSKRGKRVNKIFLPYKMEYSQKDDKFRVLCHWEGKRTIKNYILNMNRIEEVTIVQNVIMTDGQYKTKKEEKFIYRKVEFEITEERNALERILVQFANYEKTTTYDEEKTCIHA